MKKFTPKELEEFQYKPSIFKKLKLYVPDVVDLILMKTLRGYEHDLKAIEEMVKKENVEADELALNRHSYILRPAKQLPQAHE